MRWIFLAFETMLTFVWLWATVWMLSLLLHHDGDWGTFVGMLLFLAFGVGTGWMLLHEILTLVRQRASMQNPSR
jgi:hypothetical protein